MVREGFSLKAAGHEVTYFVMIPKYFEMDDLLKAAEMERGEGFEWKFVGINRKRDIILQRAFHWAKEITRQAVEFKPDVAILHDPELLLHAHLLRKAGIRVIYDMHEDLPAQILTKPYLKLFPSFVRHFIAGTIKRWLKGKLKMVDVMLAEDGYNAEWGSIGRKTAIVRNFADVEALAPYRISNYAQSQDLVYIGRVTLARGLKEMLDLTTALRKDHGWTGNLHLIGEVDENCRPLIDKHVIHVMEIPENFPLMVYLIGHQPLDIALSTASSAALGLCLLHDTDNYRHSIPTKILEYMAIGLPLLVSDIPLHSELAGDAGMIYRFDAKAVADLLADTERREKMGKAGIQRVTENFNWATEVKKLIDFVEKG